MKKVLLFILSIMILSTACEKGGESEKGGEPEKEQVGNRLVRSVDVSTGEGIMSYEFKYDDNKRVTDIIVYYDGHETLHSEYSYSANKVVMTDAEGWNKKWTFNGRGLVNEWVDMYENSTDVAEYYYGDDGLLNCKLIEYTSGNYTSYVQIEFIRNNGNVSMVSLQSGDEERKEEYTYTEYVDNANLDLASIVMSFYAEEYPCDIYECDRNVFKSLGNKYLPKTYKYSDSGFSDEASLTYKFDKEGYIVQIDMYDDSGWNNMSAKVNY